MSDSRNPTPGAAPARSVGVIGLGAMGMGVARTLLRKGFQVHACDVREAARDAIAAEGATAHSTPAGVAGAVDVIIVLVVNAAQTDTVLFGEHGAAAALRAGSTVIASSTVARPSRWRWANGWARWVCATSTRRSRAASSARPMAR